MMNKRFIALLILIAGLSPFHSAAEPDTEIRLGTLAFGTVNWELSTIEREGLDKKHRIKLIKRPVANPQAAKIALQAGAVDMIVTDWLWVSRRRADGADFAFAPYSTTAGALIVPAASTITGIKDLVHKRIGIAGGALDKNWLLLRALAEKKAGIDLEQSVEKVFGAPPLLNQQMLQDNLDALINYWHYAARLEARGYRKLLDGREILAGLGVSETVPTLGYVFKEAWADNNRAAVNGFLSASRTAKDLLCRSDAAWSSIASMIGTGDEAIQKMLRHRYCQGRIRSWGDNEKKAAQRVYDLIHRAGGEQLTGDSKHLRPGTFWSYEVDISPDL
jgi:NitT/TauT family transport system substrate-binding protein